MYAELHCHSNYSFQEGASSVEDLLVRAHDLGYRALALTDHDNLCGAMHFAQVAKTLEMQAITGVEMTIKNEEPGKDGQNGKEKYVNMKLENAEYIIDGSSYKGEAPIDYLLGTWWNHSIVEATAQISAVSGRIIKQKVTFLGEETIELGNKSYNTLHFNFSSTDKKLVKDKKLNTYVWYEKKTLNWVKASFEKKGKWKYKLVSFD